MTYLRMRNFNLKKYRMLLVKNKYLVSGEPSSILGINTPCLNHRLCPQKDRSIILSQTLILLGRWGVKSGRVKEKLGISPCLHSLSPTRESTGYFTIKGTRSHGLVSTKTVEWNPLGSWVGFSKGFIILFYTWIARIVSLLLFSKSSRDRVSRIRKP